MLCQICLRSVKLNIMEFLSKMNANQLLPDEAYYYLYRLGQVEYDQGACGPADDQLNAALDDLRRRGAMPPDLRISPSYILSYLGRVQLVRGEYQEARATFQAAWLLDPENTAAAFWANELNPETSSGRFFSVTSIMRR